MSDKAKNKRNKQFVKRNNVRTEIGERKRSSPSRGRILKKVASFSDGPEGYIVS
ncbi:hypothetical protein ACM26V_09840 [Salipaludibacillus sp. HK11]|uniref:hypothetical protein n=1 Tax=Salipaludibacillus sp. HK11 TaxID=3394320 RepID=UPI0039FDBDD3